MKVSFYIILICCCLVFIVFVSSAQQLSNYRSKTISLNADTIYLDSLSLIPGSGILETIAEKNKLIPADNYQIDAMKAVLIWIKKPQGDSVKISYQVFPYNFSKAYFHKDFRKLQVQQQDGVIYPYIFFYEKKQGSSLDFGSLHYNGSIARGISFGNNQDVVVNSSLNLQLSGMLTKDIEVTAAITDENIPIQPDGNTQQIQEFDKVYIQLTKGKSSLTVGDIVLNKPTSYFMNFYKKVKGGQFKTITKLGKKGKMQINPTFSVAKGKYAQNTIIGQEGNQGPYRLKGNNGASFIIVLAGSEKIYIDGQLMKRGADNDYIIDYNLGEITFTTKRLITKDSRITAEFEYSDQSYFRSLIHINNEYYFKKWNVRFNMLSEQDHKNQPIQQTLTDQDKQLLNSIGDSIQNAIISTIDSIAYTSDRIMYNMVDTIVNAITYDSVFVYSTDPDSAFYTLGFSNVGSGNGNYTEAPSNANGKVYKWVAPIGGQRQGGYEPVILIITPKTQQLYTLGADYQFSKTSQITVEASISNNDINTFSSLDKQDNTGYAAKIAYNNAIKFNKKDKNSLVFKTKADYEYINKLFTPIERYRSVEFERDWNLGSSTFFEDEHIGNISVGIIKPKSFNLDYGFSTFIKGADYNGFKHTVISRINTNGFHASWGGSFLNTKGSISKTKFFRPKMDISKVISIMKGIEVGVKSEMERNEIRPINVDTLSNSSFQYISWSAYMNSIDTLQNRFSINFTQRRDMRVANNLFKESLIANTFDLKNDLLKDKNNQLRWSITYRDLIIKDTALTNVKKDNALMGRLEYNLTAFRGTVRGNTFYELGRGLEQKRQFSYVKVADGEGTHIWNDYNNNSIPELDEFEIPLTPTDLPNYIRIISPTNEFEKTFALQFNQSLRIAPKAIWYSKKGIKKLLSRFSTFSTLQIQRKTLDNTNILHFNPFTNNIPDTSLINLTSIIRNTLYFNRTASKLGIDLNTQDNRNRIVLVSGFEDRVNKENSVKLRWNISKKFAYRMTYKYKEKENKSEISPDNAYWIISNIILPSLTYQAKNNFRISFNYEFLFKENKLDSLYYNNQSLGEEYSTSHNISTEVRYNMVSKSAISFKFSYILIDFEARKKNSSIAFTMLGGLEAGNNALWSLSWDKKLESNLQISLIYDGQKSKSSNTVHVGRVQARYIF